MSGKYAIEGDSLTGIASAVRELVQDSALLTPAQIETKIRAYASQHAHTDEYGKWRRPEGWPDLDRIAMDDDFDGLYLTYDPTKAEGYAWIGVYVETAETGATYRVERGHLDEDGRFVVEYGATVNSRGYFREALDLANGEIQLWRVWAESGIAVFGFVTNGETSSGNFLNNLQPCVERVGRLSHATALNTTDINNAGNQRVYGTAWLERDAVRVGGQSRLTSLKRCWQNCYCLQSLDLSAWETENWAVTSLASCWQNCHSLPYLDVSSWKTRNWAVTSLADCWQNCCSLRALDLSAWDTENWRVTSLADCWQNCYSLKALDLSAWNTAGWAVVNMSNVWAACYSIETINMSGWNTANWAVTSLSSCWQYCCSLKRLDLSSWDTSNWNPNTMTNCWYNCYCMRELYGPETWTWTSRMTSSGLYNCYMLTTFRGIACSVDHSYQNFNLLSRESLLAILAIVPVIETAHRLTLGTYNRKKLTSAEIAVATEKGWTVV